MEKEDCVYVGLPDVWIFVGSELSGEVLLLNLAAPWWRSSVTASLARFPDGSRPCAGAAAGRHAASLGPCCRPLATDS